MGARIIWCARGGSQTNAAVVRRADSVKTRSERYRSAFSARRTPRQRACSRCARYSSASGAWQGARMDGAALAFLGATSAFLLPGTVP